MCAGSPSPATSVTSRVRSIDCTRTPSSLASASGVSVVTAGPPVKALPATRSREIWIAFKFDLGAGFSGPARPDDLAWDDAQPAAVRPGDRPPPPRPARAQEAPGPPGDPGGGGSAVPGL